MSLELSSKSTNRDIGTCGNIKLNNPLWSCKNIVVGNVNINTSGTDTNNMMVKWNCPEVSEQYYCEDLLLFVVLILLMLHQLITMPTIVDTVE